MPRKQIPFLESRQLDGRPTWDWNPSPRLRRLGYKRVLLGDDFAVAVIKAIEINREIAQATAQSAARRTEAPRTFAQLVAAFKESAEWQDLAESTRHEYGSRLNNLVFWAQDGDLPVCAIDRAMVKDLRDTLVRDGRKHRTAAMLRVLRIVLGFAKREGMIEVNPAAEDLRIPEPPSRKRILSEGEVARLVEQARRDGLPSVALAIELGFWTIQRQGDLLQLSRLTWAAIENVSSHDRAVLAGPDGAVMGFRLKQRKTGVWIDAPLPPFLRARVEAHVRDRRDRTTTWILGDDAADRAYQQWDFQRRFRAVAAATGLEDVQFRDLRRSGMVFYGLSGCEPQLITSLSGHAILGERSILDAYMPGNTRSACACVATAVRKMAELAEREQAR